MKYECVSTDTNVRVMEGGQERQADKSRTTRQLIHVRGVQQEGNLWGTAQWEEHVCVRARIKLQNTSFLFTTLQHPSMDRIVSPKDVHVLTPGTCEY